MKKILLTFVFAAAFTKLSAQTETEKKEGTTNFNKWSVELDGGFNKPQNALTPGHFTELISPYVVDFGVRYMLNNKFGFKADFGYNSFTAADNSIDFDTKQYRIGLQGVANLGRILTFDTWTKTIGLLAHSGFSFAELKDDNSSVKDQTAQFMAGLTGQIKLTNRLVLTGDATTYISAFQNNTFDAASSLGGGGFSTIFYTGTVGLTLYLGKSEKHIDWDFNNLSQENLDKINGLEKRVADLETMNDDSDKDGVVDYLDVEPNSTPGVMVDTKGRAIDLNNNGIPDELESYIDKKIGEITPTGESIKNLINGGYITTYFDFGKSTPTNVSTEGIDFILTYLRNNPTASVEIIGHADEIGKSDYNDKLSNDRATNVKNTLIKAKIDASRLNIVAAGEDTSVDKDSENARKLVRRVTFRIK